MTKVRVEDFLERFEALNIKWTEIQGCFVSKSWDKASKHVRKLLAEGSTPEDIERLMNHSHMSLVLQSFDSRNTKHLREEVADLYIAIVEHRLRQEFPDRGVRVRGEREGG